MKSNETLTDDIVHAKCCAYCKKCNTEVSICKEKCIPVFPTDVCSTYADVAE